MKDYVNDIKYRFAIGKAMKKYDRELVPLRRREMEVFEMVYALHCKVEEMDCFESRLRENGLWRKYRVARGYLRNVITDIMNTLPERNLRHMEDLNRRYYVHIVPKPVAGTFKSEKVIDHRDLMVLCQCALRDECNMCIKEGDEQAECRLRNLFLDIAPPPDRKGGNLCEYTRVQVDDDLFDLGDEDDE